MTQTQTTPRRRRGRRLYAAAAAFALLLWGGAANALLDATSLRQTLRAALDADDAPALRLRERVGHFYRQRDYQPLWLDVGADGRAADALLGAIGAADRHGLRPADYHRDALSARLGALSGVRRDAAARPLAELELLLSDAFFSLGTDMLSGRLAPRRLHRAWPFETRADGVDLDALLTRAVTAGSVADALAGLAPSYRDYGGLQQALARYRDIERRGGWPLLDAGPNLRLDDDDPRVPTLRRRLRISGDLRDAGAARPLSVGRSIRYPTPQLENAPPQPGNAPSPSRFDETLRQAVLTFQRRHGLDDDGIVGPQTRAALNVTAAQRVEQLALNLERWRWMPASLGERYVLVNIAGYEMRVFEHDRPVFHSPVIVGRPDRQTPVLSSRIDRLVLSPFWHVPVNIAVKDKLPLLRKNPNALRGQKIRVFSRGGQELNPSQIDWHSVNRQNFPFRLRQDPGPRNALGRVKFLFPNDHQVYLHDTSTPRLFGAARRSFSSGCVRVAKPLELAEYLLQALPDWNAERIAADSRRGRERSVRLEHGVPVHLLYWTAWQSEDGSVQFRPDIYRRDARLNKILVATH